MTYSPVCRRGMPVKTRVVWGRLPARKVMAVTLFPDSRGSLHVHNEGGTMGVAPGRRMRLQKAGRYTVEEGVSRAV